MGYTFKNVELLKEALTHASYANESGLSYYNERLEYLGDAVLELCISDQLYRSHPDMDEGGLTRLRSQLVCETSLYYWALDIKLPDALRLGRGLERQKGRQRPSVLSDAAEALWGAVFLDGGLDAARSLLHFFETPKVTFTGDDDDNPKTRLQEHLQAQGLKPPIYELLGRDGPDHAMRFHVRIELPDGRVFDAWDHNVKAAQMTVAEKALEALVGR